METPCVQCISLEDVQDSDSATLKAELLVAYTILHPFGCVEKSWILRFSCEPSNNLGPDFTQLQNLKDSNISQ